MLSGHQTYWLWAEHHQAAVVRDLLPSHLSPSLCLQTVDWYCWLPPVASFQTLWIKLSILYLLLNNRLHSSRERWQNSWKCVCFNDIILQISFSDGSKLKTLPNSGKIKCKLVHLVQPIWSRDYRWRCFWLWSPPLALVCCYHGNEHMTCRWTLNHRQEVDIY